LNILRKKISRVFQKASPEKMLATVLFLMFFCAGCTGEKETSPVEVAVSQPPVSDASPEPSKMPIVTEASKKLYEGRCSVCHSLERPGSKQKSYDGWLSTVYRMTTYGAEFSDEEAEIIAAYLVQEQGL
jgi:hypothetical protein